jgi:hypothetical protein
MTGGAIRSPRAPGWEEGQGSRPAFVETELNRRLA